MRHAIAIVLGLAALVLVACGGGGGGSSDAQKLVQETFNSNKPLDSGKLGVTATIDPHGLSAATGPIKISFNGPFDRGNGKTDVPKFDFTLGATIGGKTYNAGATSTGSAGFLSLQNTAYALPASEYASLKKTFTQLQSAAQPKTTQGKLDWLANPKIVGDSDVAGAPTTHVSGTVDVAKLLQNVEQSQNSGQKLTSSQLDQVRQAVQHPTFDFYTGKDDHLLRRVTLAFVLNIPESSRAQLGGLSSADVTLDYQVADLNQPQTISAPSHPQPISALGPKLQALQQAIQALSSGNLGTGTGSGSGSSGSSGSTTTTPGVSKQAQAYAKCIQDAGNDVAKQQKCAALLR